LKARAAVTVGLTARQRGFNNKVATSVVIPFGIGYFIATVAGEWIVAGLDRVWPHRGRIAYLQAAQVFFAVVAFFGTQLHYGSTGIHAIFWALFGAGQAIRTYPRDVAHVEDALERRCVQALAPADPAGGVSSRAAPPACSPRRTARIRGIRPPAPGTRLTKARWPGTASGLNGAATT
jgi:hypothetical protein